MNYSRFKTFWVATKNGSAWITLDFLSVSIQGISRLKALIKEILSVKEYFSDKLWQWRILNSSIKVITLFFFTLITSLFPIQNIQSLNQPNTNAIFLQNNDHQPLALSSKNDNDKIQLDSFDYNNQLSLEKPTKKIAGKRGKLKSNTTEDSSLLKVQELTNQLLDKELSNSKNQNRACLICIILLILVLILFIGHIVSKKNFQKLIAIKNTKLSKLNQLIDEKNQHNIAQSDVISENAQSLKEQTKESELALSQKMLFLAHKNELIDQLKQEVKQMKDITKFKHKFLQIIRQEQDETEWKELNLQFERSNQVFFQKLLQAYPTLTNKEIRLCSLLKLNMTTKEIAALTFVKPESVKVARSRLRKKLNMSNSSGSIYSYLIALEQA